MNDKDRETLAEAAGNGGAALFLAGIGWAAFGWWAGSMVLMTAAAALSTVGLAVVATAEGAK